MLNMVPTTDRSVPVAMTIAGSDSGGGAGIQADLRTFAFHQVHGTSAITCVTAQNTLGVNRVDALPPEAVTAQIMAIAGDMNVRAVKTGMLLNRQIIAAVSLALPEAGLSTLVVDPVMVSRSGMQLIDNSAINALQTQLIPLATILTPNRYEAQILSGLQINSLEDMQVAAQRIHKLGAVAVLVKGGNMPGDLKGVDVWFDGERLETLKTETVNTTNTHGTGCTLSAAIAANLTLGQDPWTAVKSAKAYVTNALHCALSIGKGQGPVGHFFPLLKQTI